VKLWTAIIFCFVAISGVAGPKANRPSRQLEHTGLGSPLPMNSSRWALNSSSIDRLFFGTEIAADTVFAGDTFITILPDSLLGREVLEYSARELPLRSWLRGKSFFWKTSSNDTGEHTFVFDAELAGGDSTLHQIGVWVQ